MTSLLPWQEEAWHRLQKARRQSRLAHALLLQGPEGTGRGDFARLLCQSLLCERPDGKGLPCGRCRACTLFLAGTHPDLRLVAPAEERKQIAVDQIRAVGEFLALKPQYGRAQCVLITPADLLNENAANSLLKTLEEPSPDAFLVLLSRRPAALPATIRSRCQRLPLSLPERRMALAWLEERLSGEEEVPAEALLDLAGGAPLAALALAESGGVVRHLACLDDFERLLAGQADPLEVAAGWLKSGAKETLYWLYRWTGDMLRLRLGGDASRLASPGLRKRLAALAARLDERMLFARLAQLNEAFRLVDGQINEQLLLEDLLIAWRETCRP